MFWTQYASEPFWDPPSNTEGTGRPACLNAWMIEGAMTPVWTARSIFWGWVDRNCSTCDCTTGGVKLPTTSPAHFMFGQAPTILWNMLNANRSTSVEGIPWTPRTLPLPFRCFSCEPRAWAPPQSFALTLTAYRESSALIHMMVGIPRLAAAWIGSASEAVDVGSAMIRSTPCCTSEL